MPTEPRDSVTKPNNHQTDAENELRIYGQNARSIIKNCHALLRGKFRQVPLWSLVGAITGHGSGNSVIICVSAGLDPYQKASAKELKDCDPK